MFTLTDLIESLQEAVDEYGDLPVAAVTQPNYPLAGDITAARVTRRDGDDMKVYLFADATEYGPRFYEGDDHNAEHIIL